jgi:hypothetical protein
LEGPILPSVQQWLDWKITNVLPHEGGTLDQDPSFMHDLRIIVSVENTLMEQQRSAEKLKQELQKMRPKG